MKIAILNDTHAGIRNSSEIFLNNAEDFYTKVFFPECEKHNIFSNLTPIDKRQTKLGFRMEKKVIPILNCF